ncbi:MAG TPA: hypothetical protein VIA98_12555 [Allosphingosinicella sp.]|jgi:MYXO-CTERM domain-containing protein
MKSPSLKQTLLAAAAFALLPTAAAAQSDVKERAEDLSEQANEIQQQAQELANDATATREGNDRRDRDGVAGTGIGDGDGNRAGHDERDGDDDGGKWGLLGLLGLAGLLGLKRRDNNHHVHTDNTNRRI